MKYPNAAIGVKKLFTAEILSLIATVCTGLTVLMALLVVNSGQNIQEGNLSDLNASGVLAGGAGMMVFALGALVLLIISLVFEIQGVRAGSKDEENTGYFNIAFWCIIFSLVASVLSGCLTTAAPTIAKGAQTAGQILQVLTSYYILYGVSAIAKQIGDGELEKKAVSTVYIICGAWLAGIIASAIPNFTSGTLATGIAVTLAIFGLGLSVVAIVLMLKVLSQAKQAFAKE